MMVHKDSGTRQIEKNHFKMLFRMWRPQYVGPCFVEQSERMLLNLTLDVCKPYCLERNKTTVVLVLSMSVVAFPVASSHS